MARLPVGPRLREWAAKNRYSEQLVARIALVAERSGMDPAVALEGTRKAPPSYIRVNPLRGDVGAVRERLQARGFELSTSSLDPQVLRIIHAPISPGATLEHLLGMTSPQDVASASAPLALDARRGDVVADVAAAPGMKSLHVAGDIGQGVLVCAEPDPARQRALRFNLERGGAACAILRPGRAEDLPGAAWADRVLVDAPCTGEGTLPKDRARRRMVSGETERLCAMQESIVDAADRVLKPGGVLVYATCTFAPEENEAQVQRLLGRGYAMEDLPFSSCGAPLGRGITEWPGLDLSADLAKAARFFPGIHPSLGFFVARLRKGAT